MCESAIGIEGKALKRRPAVAAAATSLMWRRASLNEVQQTLTRESSPSQRSNRSQGRRGELQNFRERRNLKHDAAPVAVESGAGGSDSAGIYALELHSQAAEWAMRMRGVGVHAARP